MFRRSRKNAFTGSALLTVFVIAAQAHSLSSPSLPSPRSVRPQARKDLVTEYVQNKPKSLIVVAANKSAPGSDLPFVETDAKEFANALRRLGYLQIAYLNQKNATREKLIDALNRIDKTQRDASLVIYFSGHGVSDLQQKDLWLQLYGQTEIAPHRGISVGDIIGIVRGGGYSGELAIIIDSCSSGLATLSKSLNLGELGQDTTIITSSSANQVSVSVNLPDGKRMSAFTYCLIKALTDGWQDADGDQDGLMGYTELRLYIESVLAELLQNGKIFEEMEPGFLTNNPKMVIGADPERVVNSKSPLRTSIASQMLRRELAIKRPSVLALPNGPVSVQPLRVSPRAEAIAAEITENADSVTKAMKALAQRDYDGARRLLVSAESLREKPLAEIYLARGRVEMYAGAVRNATSWYQKLLELKPEDDPEGVMTETGFLLEAGIVFGSALDPRSESLLRKALSATNCNCLSKEEIAVAKFTLGISSYIQGRESEAESLLGEAASLIEGTTEPDPILNAVILGTLVFVYIERRKNDVAEIFLAKLRRFTENSKKNNKTQGYVWGSVLLAAILVKKGEYSEAKNMLQESTLALEPTDQSNEVQVAVFHAVYGIACLSLKEYQNAETHLLSSISVYERALGADHWLLNYYYRHLADAYKGQKAFAESEKYLKKALSIIEKAPRPDDLVDTLVELGMFYEEQSMLNEAESFYMRAASIETEGREVLGCACVKEYQLGNLYQRQKKYAEAEQLFRKGLARQLKLLKPEDPDLETGLNYLANNLWIQGKLDEAETTYRGVLSIQQKAYGRFHQEIAVTYYNLGNVYESQKSVKKAEESFRQAILVDEKSLGPNHIEVATDACRLADFYYNQERFADAAKFYKRAVLIRSRASGVSHTDIARTLYGLGAVYCKEAKYKQAEPLLKQALDRFERAADSSSEDFANAIAWLGWLYLSTERFNHAEGYYVKAIQIYEKTWSPEDPNLAIQLTFLANIYLAQGKLKEAETAFIRARRIFEKNPGADPFQTARCLTGLARVYEKQSHFDDAEQLYQHILLILEAKPNHKDDSLVECLNAYAQFLRKLNRVAEAIELDHRVEVLHSQRKMKKNAK